jgi:hypothetical protein
MDISPPTDWSPKGHKVDMIWTGGRKAELDKKRKKKKKRISTGLKGEKQEFSLLHHLLTDYIYRKIDS